MPRVKLIAIGAALGAIRSDDDKGERAMKNAPNKKEDSRVMSR